MQTCHLLCNNLLNCLASTKNERLVREQFSSCFEHLGKLTEQTLSAFLKSLAFEEILHTAADYQDGFAASIIWLVLSTNAISVLHST